MEGLGFQHKSCNLRETFFWSATKHGIFEASTVKGHWYARTLCSIIEKLLLFKRAPLYSPKNYDRNPPNQDFRPPNLWNPQRTMKNNTSLHLAFRFELSTGFSIMGETLVSEGVLSLAHPLLDTLNSKP